MTAQEFRIGNLLLCDGQVSKVTAINTNLPKATISFDNDRVATLESGRITAIDLTEEWLLKGGFVLRSDRMYRSEALALRANRFKKIIDGYYFKTARKRVLIKTLHQLQNISYVIRGQELTLTL